MRHVRTRDFTVYHESVISRCQFFQMISISILSIVYAFYLLSCCQFFQVISMYFSIDTSLFKPYCISVTFNNFAESKREQSLAFCLSIIMCMNFIFYLVVGFSKQFHLAYGFEANKMRSSKKNASQQQYSSEGSCFIKNLYKKKGLLYQLFKVYNKIE